MTYRCKTQNTKSIPRFENREQYTILHGVRQISHPIVKVTYRGEPMQVEAGVVAIVAEIDRHKQNVITAQNAAL
jgi:hypothetical protein